MSEVYVAGVGLTPFGVHSERTSRDLFAEAADRAVDDAGVDRTAIEEVYVGNFMGALAEGQGHYAPLLAEAAAVPAPATRYEEACASSGVAFREAVKTVRNGECDVLLVGGVERMTNLGTQGATEALAIAADELFEIRAGMTFPAAYALMAEAYFDQFGGNRTDLAHIAVKNHENALENEYAQYQRAISVEDVLEAPMIASPIGLYDACPITDGASALVLVSESFVTDNGLEPAAAVRGTGQGGDLLSLADRDNLARTPAADAAAAEAFDDAGIGPDDIDFAEVHDCFTIAEVLALESLGLSEPGAGITAARDGETTADGAVPVNLSGGLKAKGHPVGATGVSQIVELTRLLRGDHPNSHVVDPGSIAVSHNAGGTVASAVVHVLEGIA